MKTKSISIFLLFSILTLIFVLLAGCSLQGSPNGDDSDELDITQAYQTVDAQLTQAVAKTPVPPTKTVLPSPVESTPTPSFTPGLEQPTATLLPSEPTATFLPTFTHTPATRCDHAEAAYPSIDITIPDDTTIPAGNAFTKVWRVVNIGTCNWTAEYAVVFYGGEQMDAPNEVYIDEPVAPGQSIDIDVTMIAPEDTGTYQGNWMLRNAEGDIFGIGPNANDSFWVRIVVVDAEDTPTATASPAPDPDVLVSGSVNLNVDERIDLDTLQLNTNGADLAYQQNKDGDTVEAHQLVSLASVTAGLYGDSQPHFADCKATTMDSVTIDLESISAGTHYCISTDQGLIGWVRFDGLDVDNSLVTLTILTWVPSE